MVAASVLMSAPRVAKSVRATEIWSSAATEPAPTWNVSVSPPESSLMPLKFVLPAIRVSSSPRVLISFWIASRDFALFESFAP